MISWNIAKKIVSSQKLSWSCLSFLFDSLLLTFDDLASAMHWTPILYAQARRNARKRLNNQALTFENDETLIG